MNTRQRRILTAGLVVVAGMCAVPPWGNIEIDSGMRWIASPAGYRPVFYSPAVDLKKGIAVGPDFGRLGLQVLAVAALCGAIMLAASGRGKDGGT
jgi:hypothetical protein